MGKDFAVDLVHDDKYFTTKMKSYGSEIKTDFNIAGLPPGRTQCYSILFY